MKVKKIHIANFRSIDSLELSFANLNVFVGSNNAGKSNILDALNLVLGESWPSARSVQDSDYTNLDLNRDICIRVWFDTAISIKDVFGNEHDAYGFYLKYGRYKRKTKQKVAGDVKVDFLLMKDDGTPLEIIQKRPAQGSKPFPEPCRVSSDIREQIPMLLIGVNRNLDFQLKSSRYSLLGRILRQVEREFSKDVERVKKFEAKIQEAAEFLKIDMFSNFERTLSDRILKQIGLKELSLTFQPYDAMNHYKALDLQMKERKDGPVFNATSMGSGVQSAIVLALLQSYREIVQESSLLAVEEPEIFMHPQACRYFYRVLKDLSETVQVFYTTHSSFFIDSKRFEDVIYVRKMDSGFTTATSGYLLKGTKADAIKNERKFDAAKNELFFAKKVLLVEGPDDKEVFLRAFEVKGVDIDKDGLSVIECGGKNGILAFSRILTHFEIPVVVACDADESKATGEDLTKEISDVINDKARVYIMNPDLEGEFKLQKKIKPLKWAELLDGLTSIKNFPEVVQTVVSYLEKEPA